MTILIYKIIIEILAIRCSQYKLLGPFRAISKLCMSITFNHAFVVHYRMYIQFHCTEISRELNFIWEIEYSMCLSSIINFLMAILQLS